eukprot:2679596-Rhodomonas_salina.1
MRESEGERERATQTARQTQPEAGHALALRRVIQNHKPWTLFHTPLPMRGVGPPNGRGVMIMMMLR